MVFSGDLLNQCVGSALALKNTGVPHFGLYGACSTMGGGDDPRRNGASTAALPGACAPSTGSHFLASSERQYRFPLEYGGQRTPTAQWTVTGSGAVILQREGKGPYVTYMTPGRIVDAGITDTSNMGSAMAPAAYETLKAHFDDTGREPDYYDMIVTGDLGAIGHDTLEELFRRDGVKLGKFYTDCGVLIFDRERQDVHAGGSGCGCSASVFCSLIMRGFSEGKWEKVLFAPTGALMSPTSTQQGAQHPRHMPRARHRKDRCPTEVKDMLIEYLKVFAVGGALCAIGQLLIDKTKLAPARILTVYVVAGPYPRGSRGCTLRSSNGREPARPFPLTGFGSHARQGAWRRPFPELGVLGAFTGGFTAAAAGICGAVFFGIIIALLSGRKQKAENSKRTEQLSSVRLRYTYQAAVSKLSTAVTLSQNP